MKKQNRQKTLETELEQREEAQLQIVERFDTQEKELEVKNAKLRKVFFFWLLVFENNWMGIEIKNWKWFLTVMQKTKMGTEFWVKKIKMKKTNFSFGKKKLHEKHRGILMEIEDLQSMFQEER